MNKDQTNFSSIETLDLNSYHEKRINYLKMQIKTLQDEIDLIKEHIDKQ